MSYASAISALGVASNGMAVAAYNVSTAGSKATVVANDQEKVDPTTQLMAMKTYEFMYKANLEVVKTQNKVDNYILDLRA